MTMSIHKLTAGSGYDYLTRQVAALDATEKGHVPLASYYTERGETPGVWIGSVLAGIDGLTAGDAVTAEQMKALFGVGLHPQDLTAATGVRIFFAERSSPWQRGANENYNGLVRPYFPKGTNLAVHSPAHVAYVTAELNDRPRKGLGYDTPAFRFAKETASTPTR
jgi:hypothetical protein